MTPGESTSEYRMARFVAVVGAVTAAAGAALTALQEQGFSYPWIGVAMMAVGFVGKLVAFLGYNSGRVALKKAETDGQHAAEAVKTLDQAAEKLQGLVK